MAAALAEPGIPVSGIITLTGLVTLLLAPFGAFALNFAAITAAICMGREAHPTRPPLHRCRLLWPAVSADWHFWHCHHRRADRLSRRLPPLPVWRCWARLARHSPTAVRDEFYREAALITFLVTLSGVVIAGVGSAF